ncbi:glycosyltransferase family 2 protein [Buttiauxella gaviniae]|uniref:glycosyltransferase family 2 protein n=1 Tax=Buttiauxella gaviniae TaxID=82990 RepID=UPI0039B08DF1
MKTIKNRPNLMGSLLNKQLSKQTQERKPFVSVISPSFNRRDFLPYLIYQFHYQDYPADRRELIILDDSAESNEDLVNMLAMNNDNVRYIHSPRRLQLGEKRNMLNDLATGEYIICFDDDDYYPANKVSYQVEQMIQHKAVFSGCDQIYIWYSHLDKIYRTTSLGKNHALNGTFGYHSNYLKKHRYRDTDMLAEEGPFLNGFTAPVLQVEPRNAILCVSHSANTYDKDFVLGTCESVDLKLEDFVTDSNLLTHYRRLSHAPVTQPVNWPVFEKIIVLENCVDKNTEITTCSLVDFGMAPEQLIFQNKNDDELDTHLAVLELAKEQGWKSILIIDSSIHFVKKENFVKNVNGLLSNIESIDWKVILLGAQHDSIRTMQTLPGVARILGAECACAYAVNSCYYQVLIDLYTLAKDEKVSLSHAWQIKMKQDLWLGFYPSFAYLSDQDTYKDGVSTDITHTFFRKKHN